MGFAKRRLRIATVCVAGALALTAIWLCVPFGGGPLQAYAPNAGFVGEAMQAPPRRAVAFGGYSFVNTTFAPIAVLRLWPKDRSPGTEVLRMGLRREPPGIGAMYVSSPLPQGAKPLSLLPVILPPGQKQGPRQWQITAELSAPKRGAFSVQGVYVLYRWLGHPFVAFFPDRFALCAGGAACPAWAD